LKAAQDVKHSGRGIGMVVDEFPSPGFAFIDVGYSMLQADVVLRIGTA
jgi:hypothetical protein